MEILAVVAFVGVFLGLMESIKPAPGKTPEEELGAALTKYLDKVTKSKS